MENTHGIYRPIKDDGAPFKCSDCQQYLRASKLWHIETPNGKRIIICKECIDSDWLDNAVMGPPI